MISIKDDAGRVVATSKNLRGIIEYARRARYTGRAYLQQHGRTLIVDFADGATCVTDFADASVLTGWIANRVRYERGRFAHAAKA